MHEKLMKRAIKLARKGEGKVAPNPLVGAIVADENGNVISEGFHEKFGEPHAEVNALKKAGERAKGAILYVTLEPCAHYGKTPPCAELIIKSGVKKLVFGTSDTHECAKGGAKICKENGIEVISGVLEEECRKLNEIFFKNVEKKAPFVSIKVGTTLDGKIAAENTTSKWITSARAREEVQRLRNKYDAILTGSNTVLIDNPSLTCRLEGGRNPLRVLIDRKARVKKDAKIFNDDGTKVLVYSDFKNLREVFEDLYKKNVTSVLVEAGEGLVSAIIREQIPDKLYQFIAPKILGSGKPFVSNLGINDINDSIILCDTKFKPLVPDFLFEGYFRFNVK